LLHIKIEFFSVGAGITNIYKLNAHILLDYCAVLPVPNELTWIRFVLQLNLEENEEESDSDSNRFLMSSLSEAQLIDMKNEGKVCCVCAIDIVWLM